MVLAKKERQIIDEGFVISPLFSKLYARYAVLVANASTAVGFIYSVLYFSEFLSNSTELYDLKLKRTISKGMHSQKLKVINIY